ncbi:MAG: hypothetical protein HYZ20_14060 [Burkholderiales bacterium]|nr:hypothetical protein [Burkholderiales bacterium]
MPIYNPALGLMMQFERLVASFSRQHMGTLGTGLREGSRAVLVQEERANNTSPRGRRAGGLVVLRDRIEPGCWQVLPGPRADPGPAR